MARDTTKSSKITPQRRVLGCLILCAFGVSFTNIVIGHRATLLPDEQHRLQQHITDTNIKPNTFQSDPEIAQYAGNDGQIINDGKYIAKVLYGYEPFSDQQRLKFQPGTLPITSAQSLQHCYVNTKHYGEQLSERSVMLASLSDPYKIIYRNIPKSSSSTARHAMQDFFQGTDKRLRHSDIERLVHEENYTMVSFVREPLNRFYSSYDESFFRMGPWMGNGVIVENKPRVKAWYHENKYRVDAYPYLYEGLQNIQQFREIYCPPEVLGKAFLDCNEVPSIENGTLAHRFEQFVRDYDGRNPFDVHLNLQVANLVYGSSGKPLPITALYNATGAEKGWEEIAREKGVEIPVDGLTHGRKITRRFNVSLVADTTKRKICRLLALDYCCLNLPLPEVCTMGGEEERVFCALEKVKNEGAEQIAIQPWDNP